MNNTSTNSGGGSKPRLAVVLGICIPLGVILLVVGIFLCVKCSQPTTVTYGGGPPTNPYPYPYTYPNLYQPNNNVVKPPLN